jgi:hypothetical protein
VFYALKLKKKRLFNKKRMVENENPIKIKKQLKKKYDILNEPDDDDSEDASVCGIYTKKICQTKKELTEIHTINYLKDLDEKGIC